VKRKRYSRKISTKCRGADDTHAAAYREENQGLKRLLAEKTLEVDSAHLRNWRPQHHLARRSPPSAESASAESAGQANLEHSRTGMPAIFPGWQAHRLFVLSWRESRDLMSDPDGANLVQLSSLKNLVTGTPSWSPDSRRIVFNSRTNGHADLYILDIAERVPRKLNVGTGEASVPSWSDDGKWIYFIAGGRAEGERICRVPPDGGRAEVLTSARGDGPLESCDGKRNLLCLPLERSNMRLSTQQAPNIRSRECRRFLRRKLDYGSQRHLFFCCRRFQDSELFRSCEQASPSGPGFR
jgi:hypothetical protein